MRTTNGTAETDARRMRGHAPRALRFFVLNRGEATVTTKGG